MNTVSIRDYKKSDYLFLKETLGEGELFDETWDSEEMLAKRITDRPDSIVVAVIDNKVVGCVYLVDDFLPFIFRLSVKKQYRKQGIGTMLIQEAVKRLRKHGHTEISLFVNAKKEELKKWYKKQGFKESTSLWMGLWKEI